MLMLVELKRYKSVLDSMYLELFDSHIKVVSPHSKSTRVHLLQYCAKVFISTAAWKVWKWIISCFCHHRASFLTFFLFASDIFQRDYEQIKKKVFLVLNSDIARNASQLNRIGPEWIISTISHFSTCLAISCFYFSSTSGEREMFQ